MAILRQFIDAMPFAAYHCDGDGRVTILNRAAARIFGGPEAHPENPFCPGIRLFELNGTALSRDQGAAAIAIQLGKPTIGRIYEIERPDGKRVAIRESAYPWIDERETVKQGVVVYVEEIRPGLRKEIEKLESLSRLMGVVVSDIHGNLIEANDTYLRIIGYSREEFEKGQIRWDKITAPEQLMRDHEAVDQALKTGICEPFEKEYVRKDGTRVPVLIAFTLIKAEQNRFLVYVVDLTPFKRREEFASMALSASEVGTWSWNVPTGEVIASDLTKMLFGFRVTDPQSHISDYFQKIHPGDAVRVRAAVDRSLYGNEYYRIEFRTRRTDGGWRWVFGAGRAYHEWGGKPVRMSGTIVDIQERKEFENRLHDSERQLQEAVRLRDEFLSVASHELRTPITSIHLQMQMILRALRKEGGIQGVGEERLKRVLENTYRQAGNLDALICDLLDVSRISHGRLLLDPKPFSLCDSVQDVFDHFSEHLREQGSRIELELSDQVCQLLKPNWDRRRFEQVLENLISNAAKYGRGRPIHVRVERKPPNIARIIVEDEGIGIPKEMHEKIFERFERAVSGATYGGLGLGLYIVRQIVSAHQGRISVESELGKGSRFIVEIPLEPMYSSQAA